MVMGTLDENILTDSQERYLEWLCTAPQLREPTSKEAMARQLHVNVSTLRRWEKQEQFAKRWREGVDKVQGSPEKTLELLDSLYQRALQGDTKSADLWLKATGRLQPQPIKVDVKSSARELSDAELDELIAISAAQEKLGRKS